ncbi:MAG: LacI family DNA-binding transcriptional regulator [Capsulimonadaceae bacterium]|nr:LacI family DNA-binding transcriptional regulator [Capsulimonadaceae bacterium]
MTVTVRDIARRVNVSHTMVSRVLSANSKFPVSAAKRELIVAAAKELGYRPNHAARTLATGQSRVIALQIFDMENPFMQRVARRLTEMLAADDYDLIVHGFSGSFSRVRSSIDGAFLLSRDSLPLDVDHCPLVAIGSYAAPTIDSVFVDLKVGACEAVTHLLKTGRRRIVYVSSDEHDERDGRSVAFNATIQSAGLEPLTLHVVRNRQDDGWAALSAYLREHSAPDALFCQNDQIAQGCYRALREAGLRIPRDVAVIGCDGVDWNDYQYPALGSIEQPVNEMCEIGWDFLRRRIADPSIPRQEAMLIAKFNPRDSC